MPSQPAGSVSQQAAAASDAAVSSQAGSEAPLPRPGLPADPDEDIFAIAKPTDGPDGDVLETETPPASPASELHEASPKAAALGEADSTLADQAYRDNSTAYGSQLDPMKLLEQESLAAAICPEPDSIMEAGLSPEAQAPCEPGTPQHGLHTESAAGQQTSSAPASGVPSSTDCGSLQWDAAGEEQQDTGESGEASDMEGFLYDQASGFLYNPAIGAYFDCDRKLFGDASSGQWYSLQNGTYHLVS